MKRPTYIGLEYEKSEAFNNESRLVYGTSGIGGVWGAVEERESVDALLYALQNGISVFDTAPSYSNAEKYLGIALNEWKGKRPFISTKVGRLRGEDAFDTKLNYSSDGMKKSVENSLLTLGINKIDLLFLHEPQLVPMNQIDEILKTLNYFKEQGQVRFLGVGGNPTPEFLKFVTKEYFDVVSGFLKMDACNLDVFKSELEHFQSQNIKYYAASALHFALLGSRYEKYLKEGVDGEWITQKDLEIATLLNELALKNNVQLSSLAQRYLFSIKEADRVVIGARNKAQIKSTLEDWNKGPLSKELFDEITNLIYLNKYGA